MPTKQTTRRWNRQKNPAVTRKIKSLACDILLLAFIALVLLGLAKGAEAGWPVS